MKHLLTLALVLCLGTFASAQVPSYVPTNGLVGWWPLNGNANDESGNGNHGTVNGATLAADRFGNPGKAYSFDGVNDFINVTSSNSLNILNSISVTVWVKYYDSTTTGNIIGKDNDLFPNRSWFLGGNYNNIGVAFFNPNQNDFRVNSNSFNSHLNWSQITFTYDNDSIRVYFNSKLQLTNAYNSNLVSTSEPIKIGVMDEINGAHWFFKGLIDDIAIYNRALSATEVQQLYLGNSSNTAAASTVPGKIHYQGLAVGANGKPIKNGTVGLRLSVLDSLPNGITLYIETQTASTDAAGIFSTYLGGGTATAGTFANIPWANGNDKFLKVEMDAQGGTNYQPMGSTQLVSVPYALHAGSAKRASELVDSAGNAYQIKIVNGQPTLVAAPITPSPGSFACGQSVTYAGESYPTVQIGTQCWFQKNVNVGTMVQGANDQTNNGILEKYCYNDDTANCTIYGGLYQWAEAVQYQNGASNTTSPSPAFSGNVQGICPTGWHVPSDIDWSTLEITLGGAFVAGGAMKSTSGLWDSPNIGATNSSGFSALPGSYRRTNGNFLVPGSGSFIWSSSENLPTIGVSANCEEYSSNLYRNGSGKNHGFSVRCLKD